MRIGTRSQLARPVVSVAAPTAVACLCALVGALALWCGPAWAVESHAFSKSFEQPVGEDALAAPRGVAIDQSTGEVYVVDSGHDRVDMFSETGTFIRAFGEKGTKKGELEAPTEVAFGQSTDDVYVLDGGNKRIDIFNAEGTSEKEAAYPKVEVEKNGVKEKVELTSGSGIAVDGSGNLWLYGKDSKGGKASLFELPSGGSFELAYESGDDVDPGFALTAGGDFFAGNGSGDIQRGPKGEELEPIGLREGNGVIQTTGVAIDPATGDVYLDRGNEVVHFPAPTSEAEPPSESFGSSGVGALSAGTGIAVNASTGAVYVADSTKNLVEDYTAVTEATVSLGTATDVTETTATLNGEVNPEGIAVSACEFEYGTTGYTKTAPCVPAPGSGNTLEHVEASVGGLTPGTAYQYRLVATNANGANYQGYEGGFTTLIKYPLDINITGSGTVQCEVNESGDFEPCAPEYYKGARLTLQATAGLGATFEGWSGSSPWTTACVGQTAPCTFRFEEPTTIKAVFSTGLVAKDTLTVTKDGTGKVECEVNSSGSFVPCVAEYAEGTKLVVKETPEDSATFTGWSAGSGSATVCSGTSTSTCSFTITADSAITATWTPAVVAKDTLTVTKNGTGKVECEVNSSGSFVPCVAEYAEGTKLVVKETPEDSATFTGWSAGSGSATVCSGTSTSTCSFTITADSAITATWTPAVVAKDTLTVTKNGTGKVECEVNSSGSFVPCVAEYAEGTKLVVKETPEDSATFTGWSAGSGSATVCSGTSTSTCSFTITADSAITATWTPAVVAKDTLTVTKNGTGKVECEVNSSGSFVPCVAEYAEGTKLVVKETPEDSATFTGWSAGSGSATVCSGTSTSTCSFTITADSAITATWTPAVVAKDTLTVTKNGTGKVECEVNSSGSFVPCVAEYAEGTKLVVKETPEDSATFTGWSAGSGSATVCSGTSTSTCSFTITADSAITATWTPAVVAKDTLTVTKNGTGKVECEVNSSGSFVPCVAEYAEGTKLVVKETPEDSATFTGWSAGSGSATVCSGTSTSTCSFTITTDSAITATWTPAVVAKDTLTVTKNGTGKVECEVNSSGSFVPCVAEYAEGTKLVVKETPEDSATFTGWSAGSGSATVCSGTSTSTCSFTITTDSAITATWTPAVVAKDTLTITKTGAGIGKVECEVNGSGHFEACAAEYSEGTKLVLRGIAEPGSEFAGWSGGSGSTAACTGAGDCSVTITANSALIATFNLTVIAKEGRLTVSGQAPVSGDDALLKLSCSAAGACVGHLELTIRVKQGRRTRTAVIGQASYSLAAGQSQTLKVRLSGFALQLVKRFRTLDAKLTGPGGLNQTVKLQVERHHRKHGLSGYGQGGKRGR